MRWLAIPSTPEGEEDMAQFINRQDLIGEAERRSGAISHNGPKRPRSMMAREEGLSFWESPFIQTPAERMPAGFNNLHSSC